MLLVHSYVPLDEIASDDLNSIQANALGIAQVNGTWIGEAPWVSSGIGTSSKTVLHILACQGLVLSGAVLPASALVAVDPGTLTPNTWYYLYAYSNGGIIGYTWSTTPPEQSLTFMTADTTKRFVCPFIQNTVSAAAHTVPFQYRNGRYRYAMGTFDRTAYSTLVLATGKAAVQTTVDCSGIVPSIANIAYVTTVLHNRENDGANVSAYLGVTGQTLGAGTSVAFEHTFMQATTGNPNTTQEWNSEPVATFGTPSVDYMIAGNTSTNSNVDLYVTGWDF